MDVDPVHADPQHLERGVEHPQSGRKCVAHPASPSARDRVELIDAESQTARVSKPGVAGNAPCEIL